MNKKLAVNIVALVLISSSLGGMFIFTDVYSDVKTGIVDVLCLSCIKLDPKTSMDFTFDTVDNKDHPDFVEEKLKEYGPLLIQYGDDGCTACVNMIDNVMVPLLGIDFPVDENGKNVYTESFEKEIFYKNISFYYIYINTDHVDDETKKDSWKIYDIEHVGGFPQFTIITLEYSHGGNVEPYFVTFHGAFGNNWNKAKQNFVTLLKEGKESYIRNIPGYINSKTE